MKAINLKSFSVLLTAAIFVMIGCESPTSSLVEGQEILAAGLDSPDFVSAELADVLTQELDLTTEQQASIQMAIEEAMRSGMPSGVETSPPSSTQRRDRGNVHPSGLWFVSARLQDFLTERQKAKLFRAADHYGEQHLQKLVGVYGPCDIDRPGSLDGAVRIPFHVIVALLTREQRAEAAAIRARYHDQIEAIHRKVRSGELRREEAAEELQALHDALAAALRGLLTDEQVAAIEDRIAARGHDDGSHLQALKQAMIEALGLRERQVAALDGLHRAQCTALQELVDRAQSGRITRAEYRTGLERLVAAKAGAYADILVGKQVETAQIHDALLVINARRFIHWVAGGTGG